MGGVEMGEKRSASHDHYVLYVPFLRCMLKHAPWTLPPALVTANKRERASRTGQKIGSSWASLLVASASSFGNTPVRWMVVAL